MNCPNGSSVLRNVILAILLITVCCTSGVQVCLAADADTETLLAELQFQYSDDTLGLEANSSAPLLAELGAQGQRTILTLYAGCGNEEMEALRLVAETFDINVIAAFSGCTSTRLQEVQNSLGDSVSVIGNPLGDNLLIAYGVGYDVCRDGITFLIDEGGQIVLRRFGSPIWLFYDDYAVPRAFAGDSDVTETTLPQHLLLQGRELPIPQFALVDQNGETFEFDDGTPRLIYSGLRPTTEMGNSVAGDLDTLREEFPSVEFVWHRDTMTEHQLTEQWKLYNELGLYPEFYGVPLETFVEGGREAAAMQLALRIDEIASLLDGGWRLAVDLDDQLKMFWCLNWQSPCVVLIADEAGRIALTYTEYPIMGTPNWSMRLDVQDAIRQILLEITAR